MNVKISKYSSCLKVHYVFIYLLNLLERIVEEQTFKPCVLHFRMDKKWK